MGDLADLRWIGGGSGAGKSTVASLLGTRHGLPVVETDLTLPQHADALRAEPRTRAFLDATMDERWLLRDPAEMLASFPAFAGDGFPLLVEQLRARQQAGPAIVEGFRLLPRLVGPLLCDGGRAVWLLPTPGVRERALREREAGRRFWDRTSDPERALANLLERDRLFTERVRAEAEELGLPTIEIDGSEPAVAVAARAAHLLGLEPA